MAGGLRRHSGERPCTLLQGIANPLPSSRDTLEKAGGVWAGGGVTTANVLVCIIATRGPRTLHYLHGSGFTVSNACPHCKRQKLLLNQDSARCGMRFLL